MSESAMQELTNSATAPVPVAGADSKDGKGSNVQQVVFGGDNCQARIAYARSIQTKQKYVEAAQRFYQISQMSDCPLAEQMICLQEALVCAIVGGAGAQRSRLLASLYKDPRCVKLSLYPILEKAYFDRILKAEDRQLCKSLIEYDDAILEKAINEHNILCVSKLYKNIKLEELGYLIGTSKRNAEALSSKMILDGRMEGQINQISEMIDFETRDNLVAFDKQIEILLQATNNVVEAIQTKYPDWMERYKDSQN